MLAAISPASRATLEKLLAELGEHSPGHLALYLGSSAGFQLIENVPPQFEHAYVTGTDMDAAIEAFFKHLAQREVLYKQQLVHSRFGSK